jgi:3-methyl-2-oxobutanoate hydroxymethyltransferase
MVTAYDYTSAICVDKAGMDMILVGDSLGMVMLGQNNTTCVTMEEMIHHCKAVSRGSSRALLVGDMPFGSYEISPQEACRNATRLIKEGNMEAVKMEGGATRIKESVQAVVRAGIPVIGHIGLTPQTQVLCANKTLLPFM